MSDHIERDAPGLAGLPPGDAERLAAYEHATGCEPCRKALEEAEELLSLLDSVPAPKPPSEAVMRRTWNAVIAEMDEAGVRKPGAAAAADGRARRWAGPAVLASALFALFDVRGTAFAFHVGIECLLTELGTAAVAVGVAALIIESRAGVSRKPAFAALAAWSAVVAQVYLHFRCPVSHEAGHLLLFHLGGVILAALFGGPLGARLARRAA
jgi:hypothetical protein